MARCRAAVCAALFFTSMAIAAGARAEMHELKLMRPLDVAALPLIVAEHQQLLEKAAQAHGLGPLKIEWRQPGKATPLDALAAGEADLASVELAPFLIAADQTRGTGKEVRALTALAQRPYVLVTRNAAIRTIRDFGGADRIAVPALNTSGPALMLEMAAAQEWDPKQYNRLDKLLVARPDAAASAALLSGRGDVTAHFSGSPYADQELSDPSIHRVMDSFDIAGPHSTIVLVATRAFRDANPRLCAVILEALTDAAQMIHNNPGAAAEMFAAVVKDPDLAVEDLADTIGDPDLAYTVAPLGVMRLAEFMNRIGRLKNRPASWQDLFFPEAHALSGS